MSSIFFYKKRFILSVATVCFSLFASLTFAGNGTSHINSITPLPGSSSSGSNKLVGSSSLFNKGVPLNGLILEYPLNGNALDSSNNGYHGTVKNVTWIDSGRGDGKKVANFTGDRSYISHPTFLDSGLPDWTCSFWFKTTMSGSRAFIFNKTSTQSEYPLEVLLNTENKLEVYINDSSKGFGGPNVLTSSDIVNDGKWHNVILKGSTKGGRASLKMFLDGVNNGDFTSIIAANSAGIYGSEYNDFTIGRRGDDTFQFNGQVQLVRFYDRALSDTEIHSIYYYDSVYSSGNNVYLPNLNPVFYINPEFAFLRSPTIEYTISNTINNFKKKHYPTLPIPRIEANFWGPMNLITGEFIYPTKSLTIPFYGVSLGTILYFFTVFFTFLVSKYGVSFLYKKRHKKVIFIDSLIISLYIILVSSLFQLNKDINPNIALGVIIWLLIPCFYTYIKQKYFLRFFDGKNKQNYSIIELSVVVFAYIISSLLYICIIQYYPFL